MKKNEKTNVMRILEKSKIPYESYFYETDEAVSGMGAAAALGRNPDQVFKTLVTVGKSGEHYVFVIPVNQELNLKKAAGAAGEKKIEMIKERELLPLTGYVHGGCSPIGMKKQFRTIVDQSSENQPSMIFSAGRIGYQVELPLQELKKVIPLQTADVCGEP